MCFPFSTPVHPERSSKDWRFRRDESQPRVSLRPSRAPPPRLQQATFDPGSSARSGALWPRYCSCIGIATSAIQGCGQEKGQVPVTPTSAAERQPAEQRQQEAVQTIAAAQCDRALS
jgi:hypothetical protein